MAAARRSMEAVRIVGYHRPFRYESCPVPEPAEDEVLVRVLASGLCSTDLHLRDGRQDLGRLPRIPGHESAGVIEGLGPRVRGWEPGQRVVVVIDVPCGRCPHCLSGQTQRCPGLRRIGFERDGGHAGYVAVPSANLVPLPDGLPFEEACILPDATACMYHSLIAQGGVGPGQKVLILGAGGLGVHGVQVARLAGAEVMATSRRPARLEEVRRHGGVPVDPEREDLAGRLREFTGGAGADVVADCVGTRESIRRGLELLRPGGRLLVIAYQDREFEVPSLPLFSTEKQIIGCRGTNRQELQTVVDLVSRGRLSSVIGERFPLSEIARAAECLEEGRVVGRIVLTR